MKPAARPVLIAASLLAATFVLVLTMHSCGSSHAANPISGQRALEYVRAMVDCGPRPAGSAELRECRAYIVGELERIGLQARVDSFEDARNAPNITFHNIEAEIAGTRPGDERLLVVGSHYDTKSVKTDDSPDPSMHFVGANDAGSSSGLLIELARYFKEHPLACRLLLVWFDGEESLSWVWDDDKALFGSKRCVKQLRGRFPPQKRLADCVPVMVLLDMVGAKDLAITQDLDSNPELVAIVADAAKELGYGQHFFAADNRMAVKDDHWPFKDRGIRVIDLIQFGGGSGPKHVKYSPWWHTADDNVSILSAESLGIVGHVVVVALPRMVERFYR